MQIGVSDRVFLFASIEKQTVSENGVESQDIVLWASKWIQIEVAAFVFNFSVHNKRGLVVKIGGYFFESFFVLPLVWVNDEGLRKLILMGFDKDLVGQKHANVLGQIGIRRDFEFL